MAASSGSVQARHTTSRGASKTRVMVNCFVAEAVCSGIRLSFQLAESLIEQVEALVPLVAVAIDPGGCLVERLRAEGAPAPLRVGGALDEARTLEHLEVLRDRGTAHGERLGQFSDGRRSAVEARDDRAPRRIGERLEHEAELVRRTCHVSNSLFNDVLTLRLGGPRVNRVRPEWDHGESGAESAGRVRLDLRPLAAAAAR